MRVPFRSEMIRRVCGVVKSFGVDAAWERYVLLGSGRFDGTSLSAPGGEFGLGGDWSEG